MINAIGEDKHLIMTVVMTLGFPKGILLINSVDSYVKKNQMKRSARSSTVHFGQYSQALLTIIPHALPVPIFKVCHR